MMHAYDILGLGYCGQDSCCLVPGIPVDDKVEAQACLIQGGGPAATAIFAAARLGARTTFAGVVGDDARGLAIRDELRAAGVETAALRLRPGAETPAAFCWAEVATGHRSIVWTRGSVAPLDPGELDPRTVASARLLHLDGHHTAAAIRAAETARAQGVLVSLDAGTLLPDIERLLALADIVIASEGFAARLTGCADPEAAVRRLFQGPARFAGVTSGPRGAVGYDGRRLYRQPALPMQVVDSTGAGDVFHGAFAVRTLETSDWADCLRFASGAAALKCRALGGRAGIPDRPELARFLENLPCLYAPRR